MKLKFLLYIAIVLYVVALLLPAFNATATGKPYMKGYMALFLGWMGIMGGFYVFGAWFSNILILLAFSLKTQMTGKVLVTLGFGLSFLSLFVKEILANEGGGKTAVVLGIGGYIWMLAIFCFALYVYLTPLRESV